MTPEEARALGIMPKESAPPATPTKETEPKYAENKHSIDDAKTSLEIKRLEFEQKKLDAEMAKFNKPDTSIDYYGKMLEMQNIFNQQVLAMQKGNFDVQLSLAKMEMGQQPESLMWIDALEPLFEKYAPMLFAGMTGNKGEKEQPVYVHDEHGNLIPNPNIYKKIEPSKNTPPAGISTPVVGVSSSPPIAPQGDNYEMQLKEYQQQVREGKISLEKAWSDFQALKPSLTGMARKIADMMTYDDFIENYNKLREGKA